MCKLAAPKWLFRNVLWYATGCASSGLGGVPKVLRMSELLKRRSAVYSVAVCTWSIMMLRPTWCILVVTLVLWTSSTQAARILCVFPMPAPSHYFLGHKLLKELAAHGHDVTMISPFKYKTPMKNYRDIVLEDMKGKMTSNYKYIHLVK